MSRRPAPPRLFPNAVLIAGVTSTALDQWGSFRVQPPPPIVGKPEMAGASGSGKSKKMKKLEVDMESFAEVGDKIAPFVGYFPSGYDPIKAGSTGVGKQGGGGGGADDLDVKVFRHQTFGNRMQLVVSPGEPNVDFVGSSHAGESESQ